MGRLPKFDREGIARAAFDLVAEGGPKAATMGAIASRLGAPTGSIYHRFPSRDRLLGELWMEVVEEFQNGFVAQLEEANDLVASVRAAGFMVRWVHGHLREARLLLLHRREDFVRGAWPEDLVRRAENLKPQMGDALKAFCRRRWQKADRGMILKARFALLDMPYGALKPYVQAGESPPIELESLISAAARAVLD